MNAIFWLENLKGSEHSQDLGVDGNTRMEFWEKGRECVEWMHMA